MSREMQIEEMAHIVSNAIKTWVYEAPPTSNPHFVAAAIYDAGYRKQSEGEWLSAYDYAVKIGVTNEDRPASAKEDKVWKFCSRCEQQVRWLYNYCPNCGARMKGGE